MLKKWDAADIISTSSGYWRGCVIQTAVRLEVFSVLGEEEKSLKEIATAIDADQRGTELLLNALAAMALLSKKDNLYTNTPEAFELLSKGSARYIGHIILHHHHLLDGWAQLDQAVRLGKPVNRRTYGEETERESFLMGMFNIAMASAPSIAKAVKLTGRQKLLDLGGGPGTFAIHFCQATPALQAVVIDRPTTEPFMRKTVEAFNLSDRIDFIGADFSCDPINGGPYDVAWISHILHSCSVVECEELIKKTYNALAPEGLILIHDFVLSDSKDSPEFGALFSLNMLINNPHGRSYSEGEITAMLKQAGFTAITKIDPQTPNQSTIMAATK